MAYRQVLFLMTAVILAGCGMSRYEVPYDKAVGTLKHQYPIEVDRNLAAYSYEDKGTGGCQVEHKETVPGQEYQIRIDKEWKFAPARKTSITVTAWGSTAVTVWVRSEISFGLGSVRDLPYEGQREAEIRDALRKVATTQPGNL